MHVNLKMCVCMNFGQNVVDLIGLKVLDLSSGCQNLNFCQNVVDLMGLKVLDESWGCQNLFTQLADLLAGHPPHNEWTVP